MRRILIVVFGFLFLIPLYAQAQDIELPEYTAEQRWQRASRLWTVSGVAAIAYARSMGQTVEEYSKANAALFVPGWGQPGAGTLNVIVGMHRNFMAFFGSEFELVEQTDNSVTARSNRPWAELFGENEVFFGITLGEYEETIHLFNAAMAEHLGSVYRGRVEDGWFYMTFGLEG